MGIPFLASEIDKARTARQVPSLGKAQQDTRDLNPSRDCDRLLVKGQRKLGGKFRGEGLRKPAATQQQYRLPRDRSHDIMQPLFAPQNTSRKPS
jgi:hypothetical protein